MRIPKMNLLFAAVPLTILSLFAATACSQVSAQDIQGLLQAMDGKEMVIKLDDGSTVRVTVQDAQAATQAQSMVGKQVDAKVNDVKGVKTLDKVEKRSKNSQDEHFSGKIESITPTAFVIGGKTFKVNATTQLDTGLVVGATATVEFITQTDGSVLATQIETDQVDAAENELRFSGKLETLAADKIVVTGKSFVRNAATRVDDGIAVGQQVKVRFTNQPDSSMLATRVQADNSGPGNQDANQKFDVTGKIESITATAVVIDGKPFKIDANTRLDQGLVVGARARVDFDKLADGTMLASRVQIDRSGGIAAADERFLGKIDSITKDAVVVSGKTFKVTPFSQLDEKLAAGTQVKVEFVVLSDGSSAAISVQSEQPEDDKFSGVIQTITADSFVVGGKTFKINAATIQDKGLAVGLQVNVEFMTMADGSMLATQIETNEAVTGQRGREAETGDNRGGGGSQSGGGSSGKGN